MMPHIFLSKKISPFIHNFYVGLLYSIVELSELHKKKIKDILDEKQSLNLPMIEKDGSIETVFSILTARGHVWIVEKKKSKKLVGLITESDMLQILAPPRLPKYVFGRRYGVSLLHGTIQTAGDIMHKQLLTCEPEDTVEEVLSRMVNAGIRRLPVVHNDELVGEITTHYVIQVLLGKR